MIHITLTKQRAKNKITFKRRSVISKITARKYGFSIL